MFCFVSLHDSLNNFDDELSILQHRLQQAVQKLSLAKRLLHASTNIPTPEANHDYVQASLPHSHDSILRHQYGLDTADIRVWCMIQAWSHGERWLSDTTAVWQHLISVKSVKPALWSRVSHCTAPPTPPLPPMWARRFVILPVGSTCVWHHPKALCAALHTATDEFWSDTSTSSRPEAIDYVISDINHVPMHRGRR